MSRFTSAVGVLATGLAFVALVGALAACAGRDSMSLDAAPTAKPATNERRTLSALVRFAQSPSHVTWSALPLADRVQLGLGNRLVRTSSRHALRNPHAWELTPGRAFRGGVGPFSTLTQLRSTRSPLTFAVGPYPRCVSPPGRPPRAVASLRRLSIQPRHRRSCLQWWSVDAFVTRAGKIRAVTLDFWEP